MTCAHEGCWNTGTLKWGGSALYCDRHYRYRQMCHAALQRGREVPTFEQIEDMVPHDMRCHHCEKMMYWRSDMAGRGRTMSLQHYLDGTMAIVCVSCNARMAHTDTIPPDGTKRCFRCEEVKPLDDFYTNSARRDGKAYTCKRCELIARQLKKATNVPHQLTETENKDDQA